MVKTRIIKKQDKSYIELPPELSNYDEIEFFLLKDGYYLLTVPLGNGSEKTNENQELNKPQQKMSEKELIVLKKLLSIRFENRTPDHVSKSFSESEQEVLKTLEAKKFVNLFKGRKYVNGVYNVPDSTYSLVQKNDVQPPPIQVPITQPSAIVALKSQGFVIFTDKREALALSEKLSNEMRSGDVVGVKGFDGKFYVVTRECLTVIRGKIISVLKKDMDVQSIATATKTDIDGCTAVLRLMAESGDLVEKKKGIFAPV